MANASTRCRRPPTASCHRNRNAPDAAPPRSAPRGRVQIADADVRTDESITRLVTLVISLNPASPGRMPTRFDWHPGARAANHRRRSATPRRLRTWETATAVHNPDQNLYAVVMTLWLPTSTGRRRERAPPSARRPNAKARSRPGPRCHAASRQVGWYRRSRRLPGPPRSTGQTTDGDERLMDREPAYVSVQGRPRRPQRSARTRRLRILLIELDITEHLSSSRWSPCDHGTDRICEWAAGQLSV